MFSKLCLTVSGCLNQSQSYAIESQSFVLHCTSAFSEAGVELFKTAGSPIMGSPVPGSSAVVGPDGRVLSKPDSPAETLIIADLDLSLVTKTKTFADASGHCTFKATSSDHCNVSDSFADSRPDMLWLGYDDRTKRITNRSD